MGVERMHAHFHVGRNFGGQLEAARRLVCLLGAKLSHEGGRRGRRYSAT